jgi:DNA-directed RNA polymerase subunit RPC12/RpoP
MNAVYCLDCDRKIHVNSKYDVGDAIRCPNCHSEFEIIRMHPPAIEWLYDSYDDYDDYEDDEDDDEYYEDVDDDEEEQEDTEEVKALERRTVMRVNGRSNAPRLIYSTSWGQ